MRFRSVLLIEVAIAAWLPVVPAAARPLPRAVAAFIERRDACDHFRGEDPYDHARALELKREMAKTCSGTDKALAALRRAYADNRTVLKRLARYEKRVE